MGTLTLRSKLPAALVAAVVLILGSASMAVAQTTVTASWDRNSDSNTAGYRLYYGTTSGNYQWSVDAGNQISVPINLTPGGVYYFTVRGYNASYEYGPPSNEATINLASPAPTAQITATLQNNTTALVTWQTANAATATINGSSVALSGSTTVTVSGQTTFTLVARHSDGRTATATATVTPTTPAPTAQITATLQNNTTALVTWQTANAATATINGSSVALSGSTTVAVTGQTTFTLVARHSDGRTATATATVTPTAPAPTAQITATLLSNTSARVTWQTANAASATINGSAVALSGTSTIAVTGPTTFTLVARHSDGRTATVTATVTPTAPAPTAQITATLLSNTSARVTWQTANAASATINGSAVALSGTSTIAVTGPTTFTLIARHSDGRTATATATVTPTAPAPAPTAQISATLQNNTTALVTWQTANATSATINGSAVGLTGSTTIAVAGPTTFTLVARHTDGRTATATATVTPTVVPAPTAQITATLQNTTTAKVTWQTANAVSATINGTAVGLSGSTSVTIGATTTFTIVARGADGRTATANATVTMAQSGPPGTPRSMTATAADSLATLSWQPPSTGGTPTHYLLYVGTHPGASNLVNAYNVGNTLRIAGQLPRGTYYARVRAVNGTGTSLNSNEAVIRIGRKLGTPTGFRLNWAGTKVTMSWTAPAADAAEDTPTDYVLQAGTAPGLADAATVRLGNVTTFSVDVSAGTYYVRVRAENAYGESDFTEDLEVRAPGSPMNPTVLVNYGSGPVVDLRWNAPTSGPRPTGYLIEAGSASGLSDLARLTVGDVNRFTTTAPPGVYFVRVRALNQSGASGPSNEIVVRKE